MKKTLIYIASDHRSGSTLLDHLLGRHDRIIAVGELLNLSDHVNQKGIGRTWDWRCTCGKKIGSCGFWSRIIKQYEKKENVDFSGVETAAKDNSNKFFDLIFSFFVFIIGCSPKKKQKILRGFYYREKHQEIASNYFKILDNIVEDVGGKFVLDSSKTPEQFFVLLNHHQNEYRIKLIYLVRDARAVCHSRINRATQSGRHFGYLNAVISWAKVNLKIINLRSFVKDEDFIMIRYEDLCLETEQTLHNVLRILDLPYTRKLTRLEKEERHNIGGSPHRFNLNTNIQMDERWKSSFTLKKKMIFMVFGAFLNQKLGYGQKNKTKAKSWSVRR
jgi:hypothetical protein